MESGSNGLDESTLLRVTTGFNGVSAGVPECPGGLSGNTAVLYPFEYVAQRMLPVVPLHPQDVLDGEHLAAHHNQPELRIVGDLRKLFTVGARRVGYEPPLNDLEAADVHGGAEHNFGEEESLVWGRKNLRSAFLQGPLPR